MKGGNNMDLHQNIFLDKYTHKLPTSDVLGSIESEAYRLEEIMIQKTFLKDSKEYIEEKLDRKLSDYQFLGIFNYAWTLGHEVSFKKIVHHIDEILEIVKRF